MNAMRTPDELRGGPHIVECRIGQARELVSAKPAGGVTTTVLHVKFTMMHKTGRWACCSRLRNRPSDITPHLEEAESEINRKKLH